MLIGRGEVTLVKILKEKYPRSTIRTQVPTYMLVNGEYRDIMSNREKKESIDVVMYGEQNTLFRVQDKHHYTKRMGEIDERQKHILEKCGNKVIDVWEHECPKLFLDVLTNDSREEIRRLL